MEKKIIDSKGNVYMTAVLEKGGIEFRNFGKQNINIRFDARVLDQLIPFLTEANFWNKLTEKKNETHN